jgi:hypothetical protein
MVLVIKNCKLLPYVCDLANRVHSYVSTTTCVQCRVCSSLKVNILVYETSQKTGLQFDRCQIWVNVHSMQSVTTTFLMLEALLALMSS